MTLYKGKMATLVGSFMLLSSIVASANDFTAGGTPSDLIPIDEPRVAMRSEDIMMEYNDGVWNVTAKYVFWNSSTDKIQQQIGFPEFNCDPDVGYDCSDNAFRSLRTAVNDKPVIHSKGTINSQHPWSRDLATVWLFDAIFAPKAETRISHAYTVFTGSNLNFFYDINYVVKTGKGWRGNIGSARFRVKLPPAAHTIRFDDYKSPPVFVNEADNKAHYLLERTEKDWVPPTSIAMGFVFTAWSDVLERLGKDRFARSGVRPEDECAQLTAVKTTTQAQMCKNLIYAISGYPFKSQKLQKYFYGNQFDWRLEKKHWLGKVWVRGLRPHADFKPNWIPALERSFLRHIDSLDLDEPTALEKLPLAPEQKAKSADLRADEKLKKALADTANAGAKSKDKRKPVVAIPERTTDTPKPPEASRRQEAPKKTGCAIIASEKSGSSMPFITLILALLTACIRLKKQGIHGGRRAEKLKTP